MMLMNAAKENAGFVRGNILKTVANKEKSNADSQNNSISPA